MRFITTVLVDLLILSSMSFAQNTRQLEREKPNPPTERRTALVIGNGGYTKVGPLGNPVNDATDIAAALRILGFDVIIGTDTNLVQMRRLIREFGEKLELQKGVGLFYYAGHGVEVRGKNFLVPVDADIAREVETEDYAIDIDSVLRQMDAAGNGFNIVILDPAATIPLHAAGTAAETRAGWQMCLHRPEHILPLLPRRDRRHLTGRERETASLPAHCSKI